MKSLISIASVLLTVACIACSSCGRKADTAADANPENRMSLTERDTTMTLALVHGFMDYVVAGKTDSAAAMLYTVDFDDDDREPYPLTSEQRSELDDLFAMPVARYEIADQTFSTAEQNEIRCRVFVNDRVSTNWYFKPVRYLGEWYLCLKDSSQGDRPMSSKADETAY